MRGQAATNRCVDIGAAGDHDGTERAGRIGGSDDGERGARDALAADDRRRGPARVAPGRERPVERRHRRLVGHGQSARIDAFGREQIARQRQQRVGRGAARDRARDRIGDDFVDRHIGVGDAIDERCIGAVFEQPPHEIGQQFLVAADRGVDAAGDAKAAGGHDLFVQRVAHAVQALEFEVGARHRARIGVLDDGRGGVRVVRREHRVELGVRGEDASRAGQVRHVGVRLAREYRIAVEALHLRTLDFGIPVRALDQPHGQSPATFACQRDEPVDDRQRPLLIRLHGEAEAVPSGEARIAPHPREDLERQFQPLGFLGVDGEPDVVFPRAVAQLEQSWREFRQHAPLLRRFVARVQRG